MTPSLTAASLVRLPRYLPAAGLADRRAWREAAFFLAHLPVGLVLRAAPSLVVAHSLLVLLAGLLWSGSPATVHRTVLAAAYVAGAEVLWRMTGGTVFYEYGKYAVALLLGAALLRFPRRTEGQGASLPLVYFALLLPSIAVTVGQVGIAAARGDLSFNLSGPFALAVAAFFFLGVHVSSLDLRQVLVAFAGPMLGVLGVAGESTLAAAGSIAFSAESNRVTSGGFGPNQVSAVLGLAAVLVIALAFTGPRGRARWLHLAIAGVLLVQAVLTFSRGGVANAAICLLLFGLHLLPQRGSNRIAFAVTVLVATVVALWWVLPALDRFTGGALTERYGELDPGVRGTLAERELEMWRQHPILGVGPGMVKYHHGAFFRFAIAAHTEYTRLLAEHGIFGALALLVLVWLAASAYWRAPGALSKAWVALLAGWALAEMLHAAMRISAISFAFGLALVSFRSLAPVGRRGPPPNVAMPPRPRIEATAR